MPRALIDSVLPEKMSLDFILSINGVLFLVLPGGVTQTGSLVNSVSK